MLELCFAKQINKEAIMPDELALTQLGLDELKVITDGINQKQESINLQFQSTITRLAG